MLNLSIKKIDLYDEYVGPKIAQIKNQDIVKRIWAGDHTVWKKDPTEITNRLGWLNIADYTLQKLAEINAFVDSVRRDNYTHVVLLGMGGSSLAADVFQRVFQKHQDYLELSVLDSTDPQAVQMVRDTHPLPTTLFIVATKSGGTAETLSFFKYFYNVYLETMDADEAGQHFIAITDPGSKLALLAENLNFRRTFMNNPDIGGRFSVLSYFGMVPAALMGVDIEELLVGAQKMMDRCGSAYVEENNPAVQLGGMLGGLTLQKINKVTFLSSQGLAPFGDWVEQLIAESTGKEGKGLLPVVNEPVGRIEEYSTDRIFVTQHLISESVDYGFVTNLEKNGFPCIDIVLDDLYDLGALFFLWEMATALVGYCLSIQPFDQPNVEMAKHLARESMAHYFKTGELEQVPYAALTPVSLEQFLSNVRMGDYVALQAYVAPANEVDSALTELQLTIRKKYHIPVTRGYGPRFLHSTGQLHKGDDGSGLFIQLVSSSEVDLCIPDEPGNPKSSITFGILKTAQAMGDYKALHDAGRRVIRFQVKGNSPAGIRKLLPVTNQSNKKV